MGRVGFWIFGIVFLLAENILIAENLSESSACRAFVKTLEGTTIQPQKLKKVDLLNQIPSLPQTFHSTAMQFFSESADGEIEFYIIDNPQNAKMLLQLWAEAAPEIARNSIVSGGTKTAQKPVFFTPTVLAGTFLFVFGPSISALFFGQNSPITHFVTLSTFVGGMTYSIYLLKRAIEIQRQMQQTSAQIPTSDEAIQKVVDATEYIARDLFVESLTSQMEKPHLRQIESSTDRIKTLIVLDTTPQNTLRLRAWIRKPKTSN